MKLGLGTGGLVASTVLAMVLTAGTAFGQDPNYVLAASSGSGSTGDPVSSTVTLDSSLGADLQGWSFGLCSDPLALQVDLATVGADTFLADEDGFIDLATYPGGATLGVVMCLTGCLVLPPSPSLDILTVDYTILGTADTPVTPCDTLGTPPVAMVVVVGGSSIAPVSVAGNIDVIDPNQLVASSATGLLGATVDSTISFNNVTLGAADAASISVTYDDSVITIASVANSAGADFFEVQPGTASGELVIGLIMDTTSPLDNFIAASPASTALATITWNGVGVGSSAIAFTDGLGSPPANNGVVFGQAGLYAPSLVDGAVTIVNFNAFLRSDCNSDALVNIADGIYLLNFLFQGGPDPVCDDACDTDDDADLAVNDAILIFLYQFSEGAPPSAPFPTADLDPTPGDGLGCDNDADDQP